MKVVAECAVDFHPIKLDITLETKAEAECLAALCNCVLVLETCLNQDLDLHCVRAALMAKGVNADVRHPEIRSNLIRLAKGK